MNENVKNAWLELKATLARVEALRDDYQAKVENMPRRIICKAQFVRISELSPQEQAQVVRLSHRERE